MATASRRTSSDLTGADLERQLTDQPHRFRFFQAVRLLERAAGKLFGRRQPSSGAVGEDESPRDEVVRFQVPASLAFPPGEIASFTPPNNELPPRMTVPFLGLTGPSGVLPRHYTQLVIDRNRQKDHSLCDFLDLFHHRLISLFYRAWRKFRFFVGYERAVDSGCAGEDDFTQGLQSLVGLGTAGLRGRLKVDDQTWLYFAGQFAHAPRNAISLAHMVTEYLRVPARIQQFVGQWLYLQRADQSSLPPPQSLISANNALGINVVVGDRVWGIEQKFRLQLGPLGYDEFQQFFPGREGLVRTAQFVRTYVGAEFDFDVQPILRQDEVPMCRLGGEGEPSRLGWNSWVRNEPVSHDAFDAVFVHEGWAE